MGLKCSVLGHKYGEATVDREREEQGSEVVITIQERETCERCGHTRIVSENKEVTSIETPADIAGDLVEDEASDASPESTTGDEAVEETASPDQSGPGVDATVSAPDQESTTDSDTDDAEAPPADPTTEDAEIIEDSDDIESGDAELDEPTTSVDVPDADGQTSVPDAEPTTDDGVIIDGDEDPEPEPERAPGEWPEEPGDDGDDWKPETVLADETEETEETPAVEPVGTNAVTVPDGSFLCPECGFSTDVESSSLRAGDFCPECHKGSLVQESGGQ